MLGCKIGSAKIEKWGDWQIQYDYRMVGRNAIPDILPDADIYNAVSGGTTGISGHRGVFQWGLGKNTWLAFNVYRDRAMKRRASRYHILRRLEYEILSEDIKGGSLK